MSPGVLRKQAYLIWAEKTITPATLWAFLPLSFSLLSFLFLPKVIPEIERGRGYRKYPLPLNFRDDSCSLFCGVQFRDCSGTAHASPGTAGDTPLPCRMPMRAQPLLQSVAYTHRCFATSPWRQVQRPAALAYDKR